MWVVPIAGSIGAALSAVRSPNRYVRGAIEIGKDIDIGVRETRSKRWRDIWSAGHSTSSVTGILSIDDLVTQTRAQYRSARERAS
jgi:nitronate monooxygenase